MEKVNTCEFHVIEPIVIMKRSRCYVVKCIAQRNVVSRPKLWTSWCVIVTGQPTVAESTAVKSTIKRYTFFSVAVISYIRMIDQHPYDLSRFHSTRVAFESERNARIVCVSMCRDHLKMMCIVERA